MSGQHTPGPWECSGCMFPDDNDGGVYYRVHAGEMKASTANARLIAAAPELLEALRAAVDVMECVDGENDCSRGIRIAESAIRRALGTPAPEGEE